MKTVNIHYAKTHLSRLVDEVAAGDDIVIAKAGTPIVRMVPVAAAHGGRVLGPLRGSVKESAECWAQDAETEALFYGSDLEPPLVRKVAEPKPKKKR